MGFANDIIGGAAALIRAAIKSPNFVHGSTGWSINKDGTAEFQSLILPGGVGVSAFFAASPPVTTHTGDLWFNTSAGLEINQWNGSAWVPFQIGTGAIANAAITNALLATWAVDGIIGQASFHGLNMIPDPQFSNAAINTARTSDAVTAGSWTISGGTASVVQQTAANNILALISSTSKPIWVNPGEVYYYSITVVRGGASTNNLGIQLVNQAGTIQTFGTTAAGTNTVSGTFTIPAGWSQMYSRIFTSFSATHDTITFSNPVVQPASLFSPTITGTNYIINSSGAFFYNGTPAANNLTTSITPAAGTDGFGNSFLAGSSEYRKINASLYIAVSTAVASSRGVVQWYSATSEAGPWTALGLVGNDPTAGGMDFSSSDGTELVVQNNGQFQFTTPTNSLLAQVLILNGTGTMTLQASTLGIPEVINGNDSATYILGHSFQRVGSSTPINSTSATALVTFSNIGIGYYLVRGRVRFTSAASGTIQPMDIRFNGSSTFTCEISTTLVQETTGSALQPGAITAQNTDPSVSPNLGNNGTYRWEFEGWVHASVAGTLILQARQGTSSLDETFTVTAGSWMEAKPAG